MSNHDRNRHGHYLEFRKKYPRFIYRGYSITETDESLNLEFDFEIPGLAEFTPRWEIAKLESYSMDIEDKRLHQLVFSLGMVELVSYWKTTCPPEIRIQCGQLSEEQVKWWKKLYKEGLGEFFYLNGIEIDNSFVSISCENADSSGFSNYGIKNSIKSPTKKVLIPIGGGKDSAVTIELLEGFAERFCYIINPRKATLDTVAKSSVPLDKTITARRKLDPDMLALNKQGFLNGHTPFSAIVAFSSVIAAYVHGIGLTALSNESSANEPTVLGSNVNHQYSKSLEFESDFINYEEKHISSGVKYFSLLRPLTEIGIAEIFSRLEQYHDIFRSCNSGSKEDKWCAKCPKCLFVYIILSPFVGQKRLADIFGESMLNNPAMKPDFEKLIGLKAEKPFECVGSCDEVNAAMQELVRRLDSDKVPLPELADYYKKLRAGKSFETDHDISAMCRSYDENNFVPEELSDWVTKKICKILQTP